MNLKLKYIIESEANIKMSWWTYIHGTIVVSPTGRTQAEKRYVLDTVLDHLPRVTGFRKGYGCICNSKKWI